MAKVLACPSCGHKHPLDLLVGLDSFVCSQCSRKLAVPPEVHALAKKSQPSNNPSRAESSKPPTRTPQPEVSTPSPEPTVAPVARSSESAQPVEPVNAIQNSGEVVIVARSSMNVDSDSVTKTVTPDVAPNIEAETPPPVVSEPMKQAPVLTKFPKFASLGPASRIVRVSAWVLAFPTAFFIVVIVPRFFGMGFHASDFVDVITMQGIGKYKVVVTLIVLWSVVTVIFVSIYSIAIQWILSRKHSAAAHPA